ncbi:MAG: regulatory protein RecX [Nitrospirae bacterium]|nr:regulatory protein RecX [Nitrospirota bacterium]
MDHGKSEDFSRALEAAYRLLAYKQRSRKELISRLQRKGFPEEIIEEVARKLETQKYLDDEAYGHTLARSLIQRKFLGRGAVRAELLKKGLDIEVVKKITEESYIELDEGDLAIQALEKKWKTLKGRPLEVAKRRASDYLRRKGFSLSVIRKILVDKFEI